jgi:hypothetical protein
MPTHLSAWNKGRLLGQKPTLKPKEIWSLRIRLQLADKVRDLALLNLAIDSKLRGCDLVSLRVRDVYQGSVIASRAIVARRIGQFNSRSRKQLASRSPLGSHAVTFAQATSSFPGGVTRAICRSDNTGGW